MLETVKYWAWLQRSQWLKREQIVEIQARRLREMVNHAYRKVPFYRRLYDSVGVDVSSIKNARSIDRLPAINRQLVRSIPLRERTAADTDLSVCLVRTTSGSTGAPITFLDDPDSASYRAALWLRRFWVFGVRPQHKACVVVPGSRRGSMFSSTKGLSGWLLKGRVRRLSLAEDTDDHIRLISAWKPDVLVAPPSYYRTLIEFSERAGQSLHLKIALANGEMLSSSTRKLISDRLHARVFSTYGVAEAGPIAWECPTHSGYHVNAESSIVEFLRDGEQVRAGESGEVCVTNLWRKPTPMLRYLVGDVATFLDADCPCGRGLPLIKNIQGRALDFILTRNGSHISPLRIMYVLENVPGVAQYKVIQKSDYSIELLVKMQEVAVEPLLQALEQRCRQLFGDLPISVKWVDRIDAPKGHKLRVVESQLAR